MMWRAARRSRPSLPASLSAIRRCTRLVRYPAGTVLFATFCVVVANLVVDLLTAVVDPRLRTA